MHDDNDEPIAVTGADTPVPMSEPLDPEGAMPDESGPDGPLPRGPLPIPPIPFPPPRPCKIDVKEGCYRITFVPTTGFNVFYGTLRVDRHGGSGPTTVSGDLYRFLNLPSLVGPLTEATFSSALAGQDSPTEGGVSARLPFPFPFPFPIHFGIPVYPRNKYYSYLKVTGMTPTVFGPCRLAIRVDEYVYTQPAAGSFDGSFPSTPTRSITLFLTPQAPPVGFSGPYFSGTLSEGGTNRGTFTMGWVSGFFRRATLEIDTLAGAVTPQPVPALTGGGTEDFRSVFATAGWDLAVIRDQTNIPVPAGVTATNCWSAADLHAVMVANRNAAANLDQTWWIHLLMVPAKMGCGRGVMYDTIGVPREGVASFSDDGYPTSDSANFGTAANKKQRDVPRAFMRSACHEVGHGFNQQHQEITSFGEPGADNSIMTTSPSVANVLGGPTTGDPGVFPTDIHLSFNDHVRHHLVHFPDPVVRPGGMSFGTGHSSTVPQSDTDRFFFEPEQMALTLKSGGERIKLGQPLSLSWEVANKTRQTIPVPSDLRREALHAQVTIVNPAGVTRLAPPAAIMSDSGSIQDLPPGATRGAKTTLFYSSRGFAFKTPGQYIVKLQIGWDVGGVPVGVRGEIDVWVDYPVSDADNALAAAMMHHEVGAMIAMGGKTHQIQAAGARLEKAVAGHPEHPVVKAIASHLSGQSKP